VNDVVTAPVAEWLDPEEHPAPRGSKILLLTRWGVAVFGYWDDSGFAAWSPLPQIPPNIKAKLF